MINRRGTPAVRAMVLVLALGTAVRAATLTPDALTGWSAYIAVAEAHMKRELASGDGFLALDFDDSAAEERRRLTNGEIVIRRVDTFDLGGRRMSVPHAAVHHWRGDVFVPGARVDRILRDLQTEPPTWQEDVLKAALVDRGPGPLRVFLKVQRRRFVTVAYNTEHDVTFREYGSARATSTSVSTRIAELESVGTPEERELRPGDDRGFLWRLNGYWRYEEASGGVFVECESISLSRDVPAVLQLLVSPLIDSAARDSLESTLASFRARFVIAAQAAAPGHR
jgi:hypothetical protein